jgi:hypothetical protein
MSGWRTQASISVNISNHYPCAPALLGAGLDPEAECGMTALRFEAVRELMDAVRGDHAGAMIRSCFSEPE